MNMSRNRRTTKSPSKKESDFGLSYENLQESELEQYTDAKAPQVKSESSTSEIILRAIQRWSPWVAALSILITVIYNYSSINNDITNSKTDIAELKKSTMKNDNIIREIEKDQVATNLNISNLATNNKNINDKIEKITTSLINVEIEQAKANHTH